MARNKIGFHFGSNSYAAGYGNYIRALDDAGIPAVVMSVGGEGFGDIAALWDSGSLVEHVAIVRCLSHNDVPLYTLEPNVAADEWINRYVQTIGDDVKRHHTRAITLHGNELDKNMIEWLAEFYADLHPKLLKRMGWSSHRICCFNFATGEPEKEQWESIAWFLELAGKNPDKWVIGVHEYSLDETNIWNGDGYLVGRFQQIYEVADAGMFPRPLVAITEFGWRDTVAPSTVSLAINDIDQVAVLYSNYSTVLGAGIWTLQEWQGSNINYKVQKLIDPVKTLTLTKEYSCCNMPSNPLPKIVIVKKPQPSEMTLQENQAIGEWAYNWYSRTTTHSHDDMLRMLGGGNSESYAVVWYPNRPSQVEAIRLLTENGFKYTTEPSGSTSNPLTGLRLGRLFTRPYVVTSNFNDPRDYPPNYLHEGLDLSTGVFDSSVLALYDGVVTVSVDTDKGYGNYVVIKHVRNGSEFFTWYTHLNRRLVSVNNMVTQGIAVGTMGDSGNAFGAHTHINLQAPGYGLSGYVVPHVVDPLPYIPVDSELPPTKPKVDMAPYFLPANNGTHGSIFIMKNNWGQGDERVQLQAAGSKSFVVKNQQYEERVVSNDKVHFLKDTSPGNNRYYTIESDTGWMPRSWSVGDRFSRVEWLRWYDKGNCQFITEYGSTSDLEFVALHENWTSDGGITLQGVIELAWWVGTIVDERYFYAPRLGLVAWRKHSGEKSWINELIPLGSQQNNVREIGCFS